MYALKTLHIAAAVLWLGNFAVTGVWTLRAMKIRSSELTAFAAREIVFTDMVFTLAFGAAVVISGFALAGMEGVAVFATAWTRNAFIIIVTAGALWAAVLLPLELRMLAQARAGVESRRLFLLWSVIGWLLTLALFGVIYLMVAKPV